MTQTTPEQARQLAIKTASITGTLKSGTWSDIENACAAIRSLASQVERLEAELAAAKKDAERYRWLRLNAYVDVMKSLPRIEGVQTMMFDNTIDAAIKGAAHD